MAEAALMSAGAGLISGGLNYYGNRQAASAARKAQAAADARYAEQKAAAQPYLDAGNAAQTRYNDLLGLNGPEAQAAAQTALNNDPAFQAQLAAGSAEITRSAVARGQTGGNMLAALSDRAQAQKYTQQQNYLGNLSGQIARGQGALQTLTGAGTQSAATAGGFGTAAGTYNGAGITGLGQGVGNALNGYNYWSGRNSVGGV